MDIAEELKKRFIKAIKKSFHQTPLIGPKWFRYNPGGKPCDFQFLGVGKLAKAAGRPPEAIAELLIKNLKLGGLKAQAKITRSGQISVSLENRPAEQ